MIGELHGLETVLRHHELSNATALEEQSVYLEAFAGERHSGITSQLKAEAESEIEELQVQTRLI